MKHTSDKCIEYKISTKNETTLRTKQTRNAYENGKCYNVEINKRKEMADDHHNNNKDKK